MAKTSAKKKTSGKSGFFNKFRNPKIFVLVVFVLGFGAFGVYKLAFSSAAVPPGRYYISRCGNTDHSCIDNSAEQIISRLYLLMLQRFPDRGGLSGWARSYVGGASLASIADGFANSAEFRSKYNAPSNREFVRLVYRSAFIRYPDQAGWDSWTRQLDRGTLSRGGFLAQIVIANEFRTTRAQYNIQFKKYIGGGHGYQFDGRCNASNSLYLNMYDIASRAAEIYAGIDGVSRLYGWPTGPKDPSSVARYCAGSFS